MTAPAARPRPPATRSRAALAVLGIALLATLFAFHQERELAARSEQLRFQDGMSQLSPRLLALVSQRFEQLRDVARATLRPGQATPAAWADFLKYSDWRTRYPGVLEIGFAETVDARCLVRYAAGRTDAPAHPPGLDLAGVPALAAALRTGAPTGEAVVGRGPNAPRAAVSLLPLAGPDARPGPRGWLFFVLDQTAYARYCETQLAGLPFALRRLAPGEPAPADAPDHRLFGARTLTGEWRFLVTLRAPDAAARRRPWVVLGAGLAVSLLLYYLVLKQAALRFAAERANALATERETEIKAFNQNLDRLITERTAELRTANAGLARFQSALETTTDFVSMADAEHRILYLNPAGRRMMAFPEDLDVRQLRIADFYTPEVNRYFAEVAIPNSERDGHWAGEASLRSRDGRDIPISFVGLAHKTPAGALQYSTFIARDISQRKQAEEQLQAALAEEKELNRLKTNFVSMVTHEIRTPLMHILGAAEILGRYANRLPAAKRTEHLAQITTAVGRMSALLEEVLLFSKAGAGRMEFHPAPLDLPAFCAQLVDETYSATEHRCPIEYSGPALDAAAPAQGDESLLRHILANLLVNACKYSPPQSPVTFTLTREAGDAVFLVRDAGLGIPEEDQRRLFTPFHRGKNVAALPGTGLGLVIVEICVERHGGQLQIESRENAGTRVTVRLPLFTSAPAAPDAPAAVDQTAAVP